MKTIQIANRQSSTPILLNKLNKHGLITGATGTGKTITLQVLAEQLSLSGVPVVLSDVKGDLSGISIAGSMNKVIEDRVDKLSIDDFKLEGFPLEFWDLFQKGGLPLRMTISDMGPLLLTRLLNLNDTQEGIINIVFKVADDEGLLLLDVADLKAVLRFINENSKELEKEYGRISSNSVAAIMRSLLVLENQKIKKVFGEEQLNVLDLMKTKDGKGVINIIASNDLMHYPKSYSAFLLWLLSELFEELPEVGDPDKPKIVFFFDEAHLLFDEASSTLQNKIEQVVRLIRSKGVGVFFVTQNPLDIPNDISAQLGNRIQHALRAYTPKEQKAVKAAASTFRANSDIDTEKVITELGTGEALISFLDEKGAPTVVERTLIAPPRSKIGPVSNSEVESIIKNSDLHTKYSKEINRESAHEILSKRVVEKNDKIEVKTKNKPKKKKASEFSKVVAKTATSMGRQIGQEIIRGIFGNLKR